MRQPRPVWLCERQYRPGAVGAGHINCGVRCINDGGAAGLYSQPGAVTGTGIECIADGHTIRHYSEVSGTRSHAPSVGEVDGVNAAWTGRDADIDARQKLEVDGEAAETVVSIVVNAAGIRVPARRADRADGGTIAPRRGGALRQRRLRCTQR